MGEAKKKAEEIARVSAGMPAIMTGLCKMAEAAAGHDVPVLVVVFAGGGAPFCTNADLRSAIAALEAIAQQMRADLAARNLVEN